MEVVLEVAGECHNLLTVFELAEADAALVLISQCLRVPAEGEHFVEHLSRFSLLQPGPLSSLEPLYEEVGDEAGEKDGAEEEDDSWEGAYYQSYVIH